MNTTPGIWDLLEPEEIKERQRKKEEEKHNQGMIELTRAAMETMANAQKEAALRKAAQGDYKPITALFPPGSEEYDTNDPRSFDYRQSDDYLAVVDSGFNQYEFIAGRDAEWSKHTVFVTGGVMADHIRPEQEEHYEKMGLKEEYGIQRSELHDKGWKVLTRHYIPGGGENLHIWWRPKARRPNAIYCNNCAKWTTPSDRRTGQYCPNCAIGTFRNLPKKK